MRLKIENVERSNFYKMPKKIYEYDLKPIDRELYMLCLENWRLSIQNNWVNEEGEIYFYAAQETLAEKMRLDKKAVIRAFKKLVELGILQVEKEKGMLNKYFLTDLNMDIQSQKGTSTSSKIELHQSQKGTSTSSKIELLPVPKRDTIKNKYKKNELIRINKKEYIYKGEQFLDAYEEFKKMRKAIKKPMTARAEKILLNKLKKITNENDEQLAIKILEQSILNNWQDIYPLKEVQSGHIGHKNAYRTTNEKHSQKTDRTNDGKGWN